LYFHRFTRCQKLAPGFLFTEDGMTPDILFGAAGAILSLLFSYIPGLNAWFAGLKSEFKQLIMLGLIVIVAGVAYGLSCAGVLGNLTGIKLTCDEAGLLGLLRAVFLAIVVNQGTYGLSPQTGAVRKAKAAR
jgi:hypothetical protein